MPAESLIHPDDLPMARDALARYLADTDSRYQIQLRVTDGQAGWVWMRVRGRVVERDGQGAVLRIAGTSLNITGTRAAERDRKIAAEVLRSMSEAVAVIDADFCFVSVNPAFQRMTGYSESDVAGLNADLLDSDQHDAAFHAHIRAQAARTGEWSGELWQRRKDGEEFFAAVELRTVHDADLGTRLHVVVLNDITQHKRTEQELRYLANFDTLTSLPNRSLLSERLSRAIIRAQREDKRIAVLFLDLDRFKDVNDSLGHAAGDRILRATATRLQQTVGAHQTVARLGGDEFTIVIEDLEHTHDAERIAREIITAFEAPLLLEDRREITISPSIGISLYPDHSQVPTELLKQADTAMYQAKAAGRRTFMRYDDNMDVAVRQRATLSSALRKVLDRGELRLVFQPRLSLATSRVTGVEALLRWSSPEHGDIPPNDFIPLAEESGLILEIGEWVLREACLVLGRWRQHGLDALTVSVNVSVLQLLRGDFPDVVRRVLADTGIPPGLLELELTESVLMANAEQTAAKLHAFRQLGVALAIDDFGTGYSSLAYLKRLPITTIKIDKAFVDGLPNDTEDAAITSTVIAMGHSLGLNVVAEGVETEAQMRFLAGRGCDEIQGFWVAQPLDALQCLAFIRNWRPDTPARPAPVRVATLP
ncbi:EAL domain-containing protein [Luteimonas sp. SJ-16]|uniref:cyclic-guanylate-specific phosphodiesterase n=2 Tax=Luteimonas deserti TaxID=2752306 RepID=A0A7Z0QRG8_9GAMM|nr:EAL domain-containing protein [Luteimonas deserti]